MSRTRPALGFDEACREDDISEYKTEAVHAVVVRPRSREAFVSVDKPLLLKVKPWLVKIRWRVSQLMQAINRVASCAF